MCHKKCGKKCGTFLKKCGKKKSIEDRKMADLIKKKTATIKSRCKVKKIRK